MSKSIFTSGLITALLCFAFLFGGLLGGVIGGLVVVWTLEPRPYSSQVASQRLPPTPVSDRQPPVTATPTPLPTITATPTPVLRQTRTIADVIDTVLPNVVTVLNISRVVDSQNGLRETKTIGSGLIVDERGYVLTNAHVVEDSQHLSVILATGQAISATLVTQNIYQDLALLNISLPGPVTLISWANSDNVRLGQPVIALGSILGDFPNSVTIGVISGLNRTITLEQTTLFGLIQTDAAINQGNSGGPLVNSQGDVVGLNTFVVTFDNDALAPRGIGFAIPANTIQPLLRSWLP